MPDLRLKQEWESLSILNCSHNRLFDLSVNNYSKLTYLNCAGNLLTEFDLSGNLQLEELVIADNNFLEQDLTFLSHLVSLKTLWIGNDDEERIKQRIYNRFTGSLEPLKNMRELEVLNIDNTDIDEGIEYLPESLGRFFFHYGEGVEAKVKNINDLLFLHGWNIKVWKEANPKLMVKAWGETWTNNYNKPLKIVAAPPSDFIVNKRMVIEENYDEEEISYQEFFRDGRLFSWETKQEKLFFESFPTRLYNIRTNEVEKTEVDSYIEKYATLSYVWGEKNLNEELSKGGKKSLLKAVKFCRQFSIDYLWMDQLCINQDSTNEITSDGVWGDGQGKEVVNR